MDLNQFIEYLPYSLRTGRHRWRDRFFWTEYDQELGPGIEKNELIMKPLTLDTVV